jgi:deazaflavin-dependent oxidoreductase (nitroreductase family)
VGLATDLGYSYRTPTAMHRWIKGLASTRALSAVNRRMLPTSDRLLLRLTGQQATLTSWVTGLPTLWLTSVGARSGAARTTPLLGFPLGEDLAVIGTSFGQKATPGWVHNLEANPEAVAAYGGREVRVRARPADPVESNLVWETASELYPGYSNYAEWSPHRQIRVFVLEPAPGLHGD